MSNSNIVKLIQFRPVFGLSSGSPFCLKVETFLRMADIDYEIETMDMPNKAPKGKLPVIKHAGNTIADSSDILLYLSEHFPKASILMNSKKADFARSHAIKRILEEHFYFCMVYFRWVHPKGWELTRDVFFRHLPGPLKLLVPTLAQKSIKSQINAQGIGRHSEERITQKALQDLEAMEGLSGKSGYILGGKKPTAIDATVFGMLASLYYAPIDSPPKDYLLASKRLMAYLRLVQKTYFKELDEI